MLMRLLFWIEKSLKTKEPIEVHWFKETAIMQSLTDELLSWTKADAAMLNAGLLLDSLDKGVITYKDVHRICPHPINPCVVILVEKHYLKQSVLL